MSLADARALCTGSFGASASRAAIIAGVERLVQEIQAVGLKGEVWVNGSFLTHKMNPADADVVFMIDATLIGNPTPDQIQMLQNLSTKDHFKQSHLCDAFVVLFYPPGHPFHPQFIPIFSYWNNQWGFDRNKAPKGFIVVTV